MTICRRCHEFCNEQAGRAICPVCSAFCGPEGVPQGNRRWYSPGLCKCGALMYPFTRGRQAMCRDCGTYRVLPRRAPVPPTTKQLLQLVTYIPQTHLFGSTQWAEEANPASAGVAVIRDLYRLCMPDIRFLRPDLPLNFYADWHRLFKSETEPVPQPIAYDRLQAFQTRS